MSSMCNKTLLKSMRLINVSRSLDRRKMSVMNNNENSHLYDNAVKMLNSLQSITPRLIRHPGKLQLGQVNTFLNRCGVNDEDLDQLSVIHVAGTKGKGSTCVFCEQLLLHKGYRTGLFTSPHLISVRERFRINGNAISDDKFVYYFWSVYNALSKQNTEEKLPPYFMFLTVMAFKIFINEQVDVAIIETGIGGEYDCTNILRKTSIVGITSLGYDHITVLGNTLEEIAWQKSGIMKPNSIAIVSNNQPKNTHQILIERSVENRTTLLEAPPFTEYKNTSKLEILSPVQKINASLAIQLAYAWINRKNSHEWLGKCIVEANGMKQAPIWEINNQDQQAIRDVKWHGRNQILNVTPNLTYFLDGAHTIESIELCSKWFQEHNSKQQLMNEKNILIFNVTGKRDYSTFIKILVIENKIDLILLCPIIAYVPNCRPDTVDINFNYDEQLITCHNIKKSVDFCNVEVYNSIYETIKQMELCSSTEKNTSFRVLVTGSLKLVGGVLEVLKKLSSPINY